MAALYNASSGGIVLYIAETRIQRIRRVDEAGIITSIVGSAYGGFSGDGGVATAAKIYYPRNVAALYDSGSGGAVLYIADGSNYRVRRVGEVSIPAAAPSASATATGSATNTPTSTPSHSASVSSTGSSTNSPSASASASYSAARSPLPNSESISHSASASPSATSSRLGTAPTPLASLAAASLSPSPSYIASSSIATTTPTSSAMSTNIVSASATASGLITGSSVAPRVGTLAGCLSCNGSTLVADGMPAGAAPLLEPHAAVGFVQPGSGGVANLVADVGSDSTTGRVYHITPGGLLRTLVGPHTSAGTLYPIVEDVLPRAMAATFHHRRADGSSGSGNSTVTDVSMWIADATRHVVWRLSSVLNGAGDSTNGSIHVAAGTLGMGGYSGDGLPAVNATLNGTCGVAVLQWRDEAAGALQTEVYIADTGNHRVRRVDTSGMIHTIAGSGSAGFSGDGDNAAAAQLCRPSGLAALRRVTQAGSSEVRVWIADTCNHRIRMWSSVRGGGGVIHTVAG
ncbi:MAG: hypothetical protein EOO41_03400, partial [Methanobacteriota archaeon]